MPGGKGGDDPDWYPPPSPANTLERVAYLLCGQRRKLGFGDRHHALAALEQFRRRGRHLDFESPVSRTDVEQLTGLQPELLAQLLGHDDPADAAYPDMPLSVIKHVGTDYCVPLAQMGTLLEKLAARKVGASKKPPADLVIEAKIAERVVSDLQSVEALGTQVHFNRPDCGGVLWQMKHGGLLRYRCHTGHAFSSAALLAQQGEKIEETLWVALRMFEERQNLISTMGSSQKDLPSSVLERVTESQIHIDRIRAMLKATDGDS